MDLIQKYGKKSSAMRYALDIFPESSDKSEVLLAATPGEMRGILDKLTAKALKGQIPADAFAAGIFELGHGWPLGLITLGRKHS